MRISSLCGRANIDILAIRPFENIEGELTPLESRLQKAQEWMDIVRVIGCTTLQVPGTFPQGVDGHKKYIVGDENVIVAELRAFAELGSRQHPPIDIASEALSSGLHVADWEESLWVNPVNTPNLGLYINTYHVLGRVCSEPRD